MNDTIEHSLRGTEDQRSAFTSLYQQYFPPLCRYVWSRVGSKELAEDIVQKVFLKVYNIFLETRTVVPFTESYLFTAARNTLTDYFRKKKEVPFDILDRAWHNVPAQEQGAHEGLEVQEQGAGLLTLLSALPAQEQESLRLKFFGDLSTTEIATLLGTSEANVRQLQCRGLKRLRRNLPHYSTL